MLRSGLLPYRLHIRTSCSTVEVFTGRHIASGRHMQALPSTRRPSRHVTSRQDITAPPWTRRPSGHVTSRHVTSGRHRRRRRQGGRHVTSRQGVTGAAVGKDAVTSRHVRTSRGHVRMPGRHVTSRHDVRRPQSGPCSTQPKKLRSMRMCCKFSRTSTSPPHPTQEVTFFKNPKNAGAVFTPLAKTT